MAKQMPKNVLAVQQHVQKKLNVQFVVKNTANLQTTTMANGSRKYLRLAKVKEQLVTMNVLYVTRILMQTRKNLPL